jgi:hypothetical protein
MENGWEVVGNALSFKGLVIHDEKFYSQFLYTLPPTTFLFRA